MTVLRVEADGIEVWTDTTDGYPGLHHFPIEWRTRPATGVVSLFVDGECIANNTPEGA